MLPLIQYIALIGDELLQRLYVNLAISNLPKTRRRKPSRPQSISGALKEFLSLPAPGSFKQRNTKPSIGCDDKLALKKN